jgi:hypothetical protein
MGKNILSIRNSDMEYWYIENPSDLYSIIPTFHYAEFLIPACLDQE